MPKIPLYNQGLGPSQTVRPASLGPRASSATFEAPGLAYAQLAKTAGDIAYQFGMAEKQAETDRYMNKISTDVNQEMNDWTNKSEATSTEEYQAQAKAKADELRRKHLAGLEGKLTRSQFRDVTNQFDKTMAAKIATGSQIAFNKGQVIRGEQAKTTVTDTISQLRSLDPSSSLYQEISTNLDAAFDRWAAQGLNVGYTKTSYRKELSNSRFIGDIENAKTSASIEKMRSQAEADRPNMTAAEYAQRLTAIDAQEKVVDGLEVDAVYQRILENKGESWATQEKMDEAIKLIKDGGTITLTTNAGEVVPIDFSTMKTSNRAFLIEKIKAKEKSERSEIVSANLNNINGKIQDMSLDELRKMEQSLTLTGEDGKFQIAPDVTRFNDRQAIARLVNGEIAQRARRALADASEEERNLSAKLMAQDGVMEPEDAATSAKIIRTLENAEEFAAADKHRVTVEAATNAAKAFKSIEFANAETQKAALDNAYKNRGTEVGMKEYELLRDRLAARDKEIKDDFIGYWQRRNPGKEVNVNDLISVQKQMGIAPLDIRVTSNAQLKAFQSEFEAAETYEQKAQIGNDFINSFGENQARVLRHLVGTKTITDVDMLTIAYPDKVGIRAVTIGNDPDNVKRYKTDLDTETRNTISERVRDTIGDYSNSVLGGGMNDALSAGTTKGRASHVFSMMDIVKNTASFYITSGAVNDIDDAVERAYKDVIGDHFVFGDVNKSKIRYKSNYAPIEPEMTSVLNASIVKNVEYLKSVVIPPPPPAGVSTQPEIDAWNNQYFQDLADHGSWRTTTDNNGVYLVDASGNLVPRMETGDVGITDEGGDPMAKFVTIPFSAVAGVAEDLAAFKALSKFEQREKIKEMGIDAQYANREQIWIRDAIKKRQLF